MARAHWWLMNILATLIGCTAPPGFDLASIPPSSGSSSSSSSASAGGSGGDDLGLPGFGGAGAGFEEKPFSELEGLESITFYENTSGIDAFTFTIDGSELTAQLPDPLSDSNYDISGAPTEWYDVYYSDADGDFQLDGSYLTISGVYSKPLPKGGGLNLSEIGLNFTDAPPEYGNYVASYVALGDNKQEDDVDNCIDGNLDTHTTMGNVVGQGGQRLRLTLGFESTSSPPPN